MKESFVFYQSFADAMEDLTDEQCGRVSRIIYRYALQNIEPENLSGIEKIIFTLIRPQLDANNKRYLDGKKGGRPKTKKTSGFENKKPVVLKNEEEKKPNVNVNVNVNDNENVNVNVNDNENVVEEKTTSQNSDFNSYFLGEFLNVFLNEHDKKKAQSWCLASGFKFDDLVNELSYAIESGKYPVYDETRPSGHLAILKKFIDYRQLHPKKKDKVPISQMTPEEMEENDRKIALEFEARRTAELEAELQTAQQPQRVELSDEQRRQTIRKFKDAVKLTAQKLNTG